MELPQLPADVYLAIALVIATPWLYHIFSTPKTPTQQTISTLVLAHTLYMLYALFVSPPQNIFKVLGVALDAAPEYMRAKVEEMYGGAANVPPHLGQLLKRLGLSDLRSFYVRFGHDTLTTCEYCHSFGDYALYAFPGPLLEYIRELAFVGVLTLPKSPTAHFRPLGLGALLVALMSEVYWTLTVQVTFPSGPSSNTDITMWHDHFVQLRHALFLALPLILTMLPSMGLHRVPILGAFVPAPEVQGTRGANLPPAQFQLQGQQVMLPPDATLTSTSALTMGTLQHLVPTLHLLKYANAAVMRLQSPSPFSSSPASTGKGETEESVHARATRWWAEEAREGEILRTDEDMRKILEAVGLSTEPEVKEGDVVVQPEGKLAESARMMVNFLQEQGSVPSEMWRQ
ncbi:hypothetical protein BDN70DRAFT_870372 [Pholiota conissans]|uniref:Uncharacterized protein n=1 Tax=Pholiota conissans TaxID=109636 RepID=A0A9P6CZE0_9AGAR|nr:hypothetical protein BDN70DRAFT_870372 [Pholiota conissans]